MSEPFRAAFPAVLASELATQRAKLAGGGGDAGAGEPAGGAVARSVDHLSEVAKAPPADQAAEFKARYGRVCFDFAQVDSKQKALKVFMNTFYGEAGNKRSAFFLLQLAGGVTAAGRYNIKGVADYVESLDFVIMYGDTDSIYVCAPHAVFAAADLAYVLGETTKEEYWTAQVVITMDALGVLRNQVNDWLRADNGTGHLRMAYEEVLFPVVFTGKKKYFGIAHMNIPNFRPKKIFIRGIDVVKQGQTQLARDVGHRVMWAAVALDNADDLLTIVEKVVTDAVANGAQWNFGDFVQSDAWKPAKNNVSVQRFIARMRVRVAEERAENDRRAARGEPRRKELYYIPEAGERFRYVLVRAGAAFDLRGRKAQPKKGDVMEYETVAQALGLPVDVGKYMTSYVVGLCARFINYAPRFQPEGAILRLLDPKTRDVKAQAAAKKYLEALVAGLQGADPETVRHRGYAYKRAFKLAAAECGERLFAQLGPAAEVLHGGRLSWDDFLPAEGVEVVETLAVQARGVAEEVFRARADALFAGQCAALGITPRGGDAPPGGLAQPGDGGDGDGGDGGGDGGGGDAPPAGRLYALAALLNPPRRGRGAPRRGPPLHVAVLAALDRAEAAARAELSALVPATADLAARYEARLARAVARWRAREHEALPDNLGVYSGGAADDAAADGAADDAADLLAEDGGPPALENLAEVRRVWYVLVGVYGARELHRALAERVAALKARRQRAVARPAAADARRAAAEFAGRLPPLGNTAIGGGGY